jgi:hypothetical protein
MSYHDDSPRFNIFKNIVSTLDFTLDSVFPKNLKILIVLDILFTNKKF